MRSVTDRSSAETERLLVKQSELRRALADLPMMEFFSDFQRTWSLDNQSYRFEGTYSRALFEVLGRRPDAEELIILVHGSIIHGGAHCIVSDDCFKGRVYV